ncbi:TetR/AcrR family transcriptional regulator [Pendulispora albinea]|uniref:TetR/AcrR family transcriptional regulator n=1 Tax=Pendulispora albinea TaxID=2741071 RepID=A0ABZ2M8S7_9BACT
MTTERVYGGLPRLERRERRRQRLLEAALDAIGEGGLKGLSLRSVCARAGLTSRYFYESFRDLDELLVALFDRVADEVTGATLDAVAQAPWDALARAHAGLEAAIHVITDDHRKAKLLLISGSGPESLQRRRREQLVQVATVMSKLTRDFYGADRVTPTDARLTTITFAAGYVELLHEWLSGSLPVSRTRLVDHMARIFVASATVHSGRAAAPPPSE